MWELDHKEDWALKNWCFLTVVLEKTLESPLDCTEIRPVNPKGNQSWMFIGSPNRLAQSFGSLMRRAKSLDRTLMVERLRAGGEGDDRGSQRINRGDDRLDGIRLWKVVKDREAWHAAACGVARSRSRLGDCTAVLPAGTCSFPECILDSWLWGWAPASPYQWTPSPAGPIPLLEEPKLSIALARADLLTTFSPHVSWVSSL